MMIVIHALSEYALSKLFWLLFKSEEL